MGEATIRLTYNGVCRKGIHRFSAPTRASDSEPTPSDVCNITMTAARDANLHWSHLCLSPGKTERLHALGKILQVVLGTYDSTARLIHARAASVPCGSACPAAVHQHPYLVYRTICCPFAAGSFASSILACILHGANLTVSYLGVKAWGMLVSAVPRSPHQNGVGYHRWRMQLGCTP